MRVRAPSSARSQPSVSARTPWRSRELRGQLLEPLLAAGDERHAVPAPRERAGDLGADSRRGAGHEAGGAGVGRRQRHRGAKPSRCRYA